MIQIWCISSTIFRATSHTLALGTSLTPSKELLDIINEYQSLILVSTQPLIIFFNPITESSTNGSSEYTLTLCPNAARASATASSNRTSSSSINRPASFKSWYRSSTYFLRSTGNVNEYCRGGDPSISNPNAKRVGVPRTCP